MPNLMTCPECGGDGSSPYLLSIRSAGPDYAACERCKGEGKIPAECDRCGSIHDVDPIHDPWGTFEGWQCQSCTEDTYERYLETWAEDKAAADQRLHEAWKFKR